jgi:hypothetical protein
MARQPHIQQPVFAQPEPTEHPGSFLVRHPLRAAAYGSIDALNAAHGLATIPFPPPRGLPEPVLTLAQVLADPGADAKLQAAGQIVFHAVGDTGSTSGPASQALVAAAMVGDFHAADAAQVPVFWLHLGDVVYFFGQAADYPAQFYEPYKTYPAPILALAGNHDGLPAPGTKTPTLAAFLQNFCAPSFVITPESGGLSRTAQIEPGVFFTLEAPFARILCLYSNVLEDPGVIAGGNLGSSQLAYLQAALQRVRTEDYGGALIIAHHHPPYTFDVTHTGSVEMLAQIDAACAAAGVWPHAVLSGHVHNYQRFTRTHGQWQIPYIVAGNGGHDVTTMRQPGGRPPQLPLIVQKEGGGNDQVVLENFDDRNYGYLRVVVTATQLSIAYHPASGGAAAKTQDDVVTVDLASRTLVRLS